MYHAHYVFLTVIHSLDGLSELPQVPARGNVEVGLEPGPGFLQADELVIVDRGRLEAIIATLLDGIMDVNRHKFMFLFPLS